MSGQTINTKAKSYRSDSWIRNNTGNRTDDSVLNILVKGRMNRDVLRTLAHEWTHEYQRINLGREQGPDIGGKNEDEANAMAGRIMKMFEKEHPEKKDKLYERAERLVSLINENNNINYIII